MKALLAYTFTTAYNDGAGATGTYTYVCIPATRIIVEASKDMWNMHVASTPINLAAMTLTAFSRTVGGGAPPAAAARTVDIDVNGVCAFLDAHETLTSMAMQATILECEDHTNLDPVLTIGYETTEIVATNTDGVGALTPDSDGYFSPVFVAAGDYIRCVGALTAGQIALSKLPLVSFVFGDRALLTRPYVSGAYEIAAKAALVGLELVGHRLEGLVAQLTTFMRGQNNIGTGFDIPTIMWTSRWGVV